MNRSTSMILNISLWLILYCAASRGAMASMDREFVEVISHQDKSYLIASLFRDEQPIKRPLLKIDDKLQGGDNSKPAEVLRQYYELMIQGQPKKAASLFFTGDNSQERYVNGLLSMPDRYAGYTMLERIDFLGSYGWGPFEIFEVKLSGAQAGSLNWREAVICGPQKCFLSNKIDQPDASLNEFASIRRLVTKTPAKQQELALKFSKLNNKALYLPDNAMAYSAVQNTQYPMAFSFDMEQVTPVTIDLGQSTKNTKLPKYNGVDVSVLLDFINDIHSLSPLVASDSLKQQKDSDPEKEKVIREYSKTVDRYTTNQATRDVFLYSVFEDQEKNLRSFKREWYHPVAAVQRISRWQKIILLGYIPQDDQQIALFFQPMSVAENGDVTIEPIQGIAIAASSTGSKIMLTNFRNNAAQKINFALEAAVLDALGKKYAQDPTLIYQM